MAKTNDTNETPLIFLSMFWGGGGPYTIPEIVGCYDGINKAIPKAADMELALNTLLAMGLVDKAAQKFLIPTVQSGKFAAFLRKKRKGRFENARLYFAKLQVPASIPKVLRLTQAGYNAAVKEYKKRFWALYRNS